jgi:hypothetical protein
MKRLVKHMAANLLVATVGLGFGLILLEVGVRVFGLYRFPPHDFVQPHPEVGWGHIPGKEGFWEVGGQRIPVKINSKGLRDKEYSYEKDRGVFRILVLGDSFTEGFQVPLEDTFCKVLERRLNKGGRHVEVLNAGFAGIGTDYELLFFSREGYKYRPDLVLLAFFGNDISDNFRSKDILDGRGIHVAYEKKGAVVRLKQLLAKNSCAYNYLGLVLPARVPVVAGWLMKLGLLSSQPLDTDKREGRSHTSVFAKEYSGELLRAWELTEMLISQLEKQVRESGASLLVVNVPFAEQMHERQFQSQGAVSGTEGVEWDFEKPDKLLSRFLGDYGIPFLDLLAAFRKQAEKTDLYYTGSDGHWNVAGHRLAGEVIGEWLETKGLITQGYREE